MRLIERLRNALRRLAEMPGFVPEAEARAADDFRSLVQQAAMEAIWLAQHEYLNSPALSEINNDLHAKVLFLGAEAESLYAGGDFKEALAVATECLRVIREAVATAKEMEP